MKNAIGLIESKGLVALIEATDVILKNSPVEVLWVKKLNNGLLTLAVSGESDYVKAAMEMAVEAANKVGEIYSHSVIENPDDKLLNIFEETSEGYQLFTSKAKAEKEVKATVTKSSSEIVLVDSEKTKDNQEIKPIKKFSNKNKSKGVNSYVPKEIMVPIQKAGKNSKIDQNTDSSTPHTLSTLERLRREALGLSGNEIKIKKDEKEKSTTNVAIRISENHDFDLRSVEQMNVHELRRYAREFENFPIKGRQISRANRSELVELFKKINS